ncbi:MAG: SHOCT domain-containing protein [Alphaproteobacteria bacterium]
MATEEQDNPLGDDALKAAAREAVKFQPLPEPDLAGMAEPAAAAFDFNGDDFAWARDAANSNEKPQALALVSDEDEKVPRAVREAEAAALVVEMGLSLADPAVAKAVDAILKSRTRKELSENIAEARDALQSIAADKAQANSGGVEAEKARIWGEIGKVNEAIKLDLEELHKRGLISDEEYEKLKKERARLDKLDVNDPARLEGEKLYNNRIHAIAEQANQTAQAAGDTHGQAVAQRTETHAQQQDQNLYALEQTIDRKRIKPTAGEAKETGSTSTIQPTPANKAVGTDDAEVKAGQETRITISPAVISSFGGFGSENESSVTPTPIKDAKSVVSPTLVASFSGFDAPEGAPAQTSGAKPKGPVTRQS